MTKKEQIEEMAKTLCGDYCEDEAAECKYCLKSPCDIEYFAVKLYNAGYRKINPDDDATKEIALLKSELKKELEEHEAFVNNMKNVLEIEKENAVKEFAEKLKKVIHERDYVRGYAEIGMIEEVDELLKEFLK